MNMYLQGKVSTSNIFTFVVHYIVHWLNHKSLIYIYIYIYIVFSMITLQGTKQKHIPLKLGISSTQRRSLMGLVNNPGGYNYHLKNGGSEIG